MSPFRKEMGITVEDVSAKTRQAWKKKKTLWILMVLQVLQGTCNGKDTALKDRPVEADDDYFVPALSHGSELFGSMGDTTERNFAGQDNFFNGGDGRLDVGMIDLSTQTHAGGEVAGTDGERIHAGGGDNFGEIGDGVDVFDGSHGHDFSVGGFEISGDGLAIAHGSVKRAPVAFARGRVANGASGGFGVLARGDHREADAHGAEVERKLGVLNGIVRDADERSEACPAGGSDHGVGRGEVDGAVLHIDDDEIEGCLREGLDDLDGGDGDDHAEDGAIFGEHGAHAVERKRLLQGTMAPFGATECQRRNGNRWCPSGLVRET